MSNMIQGFNAPYWPASWFNLHIELGSWEFASYASAFDMSNSSFDSSPTICYNISMLETWNFQHINYWRYQMILYFPHNYIGLYTDLRTNMRCLQALLWPSFQTWHIPSDSGWDGPHPSPHGEPPTSWGRCIPWLHRTCPGRSLPTCWVVNWSNCSI